MLFPNATLHVQLGDNPLPFCYEYAPFLWGAEVDYNSDGDAYDERQLNQWTILDISHRITDERLLIRPLAKLTIPSSLAPMREHSGVFVVQGDEMRSVQLASYLTAFRSHGIIIDPVTVCEIPLNTIVTSFEDISERINFANKLRVEEF